MTFEGRTYTSSVILKGFFPVYKIYTNQSSELLYALIAGHRNAITYAKHLSNYFNSPGCYIYVEFCGGSKDESFFKLATRDKP